MKTNKQLNKIVFFSKNLLRKKQQELVGIHTKPTTFVIFDDAKFIEKKKRCPSDLY